MPDRLTQPRLQHCHGGLCEGRASLFAAFAYTTHVCASAQGDVGALFEGPGRRFALEVRGDSMSEAGILDGDLVIIEPRDSADDGAIVVALIDEDEATLKRLQRRANGEVALIPANRDMAPMIYPADRVRIQGVLVNLMRRY